MAKTNSSNQPTATSKPSKQSKREVTVRIRKSSKRFGLMNFNLRFNFKLENVRKARLQRIVNAPAEPTVDQLTAVDQPPEFGAGSRFGQSSKFVPKAKVIDPEKQPYIFETELADGTTKDYVGTREGGMINDTVYYVFTLENDKDLVGYPLDEWHTFRPLLKYDLNEEEEEEKQLKNSNQGIAGGIFKGKKLKIAKFFGKSNGKSSDTDSDLDGETIKKTKNRTLNCDLEEVTLEDDDDDNKDCKSSDDDSDQGNQTRKRSKGRKSLKFNSDEEAFEDEDDGDQNGQECDHSGDSSESDNDLDSSFDGDENNDKEITGGEKSDEESENEFKDFFKWKPDEDMASDKEEAVPKKRKGLVENDSASKSSAKKRKSQK